MDTITHPAHLLLGTKAESKAKATSKVAIGIISIMMILVMIGNTDQDMIKRRWAKYKTKLEVKARRSRRQ